MVGSSRGECADAGLLDQGDVALLLTGNHMADDEGNLCGDGLLHGGPAGFADKHMVCGHELRHFIRPAGQRSGFRKSCRGEGFLRGFPVSVSSSLIRARRRAGLSVQNLVPAGIAEAIADAKLYAADAT